MHERTVRLICRTSFLVGCVGPTLGVMYWILGSVLPGTHRAQLAPLAARLGVDIQTASFATPQPGNDRYLGVLLSEPESGESLAFINRLEVFRRSDRTTLVADQIDCRRDRLDRLWQALSLRLQTPQTQPVRLVAKAIEVKTPAGPVVFRNVDIDLRSTADSSLATVIFHMAKDAEAAPLRLKIARSRASQPPTVEWQLETGAAEFPCQLAAALLPRTSRLGEDCKLQGTAWGRISHGQWHAALSGVLSNVDMQSLLAAPFPYPVTGMATLQVERAELEDGRLLNATAAVTVGPGTIAPGLVAAAIDRLGVVPVREMPSTGPIPFEQLALAFRVDQQGLIVRGRCTNSGPGDLLVDQVGPLLAEPRVATIPVANLVYLLSPNAPTALPATAESAAIAGMLPLPAAPQRR